MKNIRTDNYLKIFLVLFLAGLFLFSGNFNTEKVKAAESDAIAVRVLPNTNHYSPLTWYKKQGFKGSPVALKVDGYEAVQDGRTVYVNVANVVNSSFYTNIYIISYTQEATAETQDIFSNILKNWRFNINLNEVGTCIFQSDTNASCIRDTDCTGGGFCDSEKAKLTRDMKRLGDIIDLRMQIESYKNTYGFYPKLSAGTYLPGKSISTWPSWSGEFKTELGITLPVDPINKLGSCVGYDSTTCWDEKTKSFAQSGAFLPYDSYAFFYTTPNLNSNEPLGKNYNLCATMESQYTRWIDEACKGSSTQGAAGAPEIDCGNMIGISGQPFTGYVKVTEPNNLPITEFKATNLNSNFASSTAITNAIKITTDKAPATGIYKFNVSATNINGNTAQAECSIAISSKTFVIYPIEDQKILDGKTSTFSIYAYRPDKDYNNLDLTFSGSNLKCIATSTTADERFQCNVKYVANTKFSGTETSTTTPVTVYAENHTDKTKSSSQTFNLTVYDNPPVIESMKCDKTSLRFWTSNDFENFSCSVNVNSPAGNTVTLKAKITDGAGSNSTGAYLFNNLDFNQSIQGSGTIVLNGANDVQYQPVTPKGTYTVSVTAFDNFGVASQPKTFIMKIVDYCGDKLIESPNGEHLGGPKNDGYEECDGVASLTGNATVTSIIAESNPNKQYGTCTNTCAINREGYCNDGIVQDGLFDNYAKSNGLELINGLRMIHSTYSHGEQCDFNGDNDCCVKCNWALNSTEIITLKSDNTWTSANLPVSDTANEILSKGRGDNYWDIPIPQQIRGIKDGSVDIKEVGGTELIFLSDLSNIGANNVTAVDFKQALKNSLDNFYEASNASSSASDFYVGMIGFGATINHTGGPILFSTNGFFNLRNSDNYSMGELNKATLEDQVDYYNFGNDYASGDSGITAGITAAKTMFDNFGVANGVNGADYKKYVIILSDGVNAGTGKNAEPTLTNILKEDAGAKIYTMSWAYSTSNHGYENMCNWSSSATCAGTKPTPTDYYYQVYNNKVTDLTDITNIYNQVRDKIIADTPKNITYEFSNVPNQSGGSLITSGISCDISGRTGCKLSSNGGNLTDIDDLSWDSGDNAKVKLSNLKLNVYPLCK